jgi:hypothetical protein
MKMEGITLETSSLSLSPDSAKKLSFGDDMDVDDIEQVGGPMAQGGDAEEDSDMYTEGEDDKADHSSVSIVATDNPQVTPSSTGADVSGERSIEAEERDKNDLASLFSDHEGSQEQDKGSGELPMVRKGEIGAPPSRFYGRAGAKRKREDDQEEDVASTQESQVEIVATKDDAPSPHERDRKCVLFLIFTGPSRQLSTFQALGPYP